MKKVVVTGVDGSETAAAAALTAAELTRAMDAELLVVCAFGDLGMEKVETDGREYVFSTAESALELAQSSIGTLSAQFPGLRSRAVAEQGKPAEALLQVIDRSHADLIVVGNKRVQGAGRILGSIATDIARRATCDVYIAYTHSRP